MSAVDLKKLWEDEFRADLRKKRTRAANSLASLRSEGAYREAHIHVLKLFDAAIAAVDAKVEP